MAKLPAGARKLKSGRYEQRFSVNGKRYSVYGASLKELKEKELERRAEIAAGVVRSGRELTLGKYFDQWIKNQERSVSGNTVNSYTLWFKAIKDAPISNNGDSIADIKLSKIDASHIQNLQAALLEKYVARTTNSYISLVKMILRSAVNARLITWNPCDGIRAVKSKDKPVIETTHRALSIDETEKFLEAAADNWYLHLFELMLNTGMRVGEASALYPSDIDFAAGIIHIKRTITKDKTGKQMIGDATKTKAGKRDIPLNEGARDAIRAQMKLNEEMYGKVISFDARKEEKPIFRSLEGKLIRAEYICVEMAGICKRAGIEKISSHGLRDTFATRCAESGMDIKTLQEILGHSDIKQTLGIYVHCMPERKREQMLNVVIRKTS